MNIIIVGASVTGLAAAAVLADRGHAVHVLERDPQEPPSTLDEAAPVWARPTVPQAAHSHAFASLGCNLLRDRIPDVHDALLAAGAGEVRLADSPPPSLSDFQREDGDEQLRMLTVRRSVFDWVLRQRALSRSGVRLDSGRTVRGLIVSSDEPRRVIGVRLEDGEVLHADLVLDASGRRSSAASWLSVAGLPAPELTSESCRIVYYTRYYRRLTDQPPAPLNRGFGSGGLWNHYTAVLFLGDNNTFSISIGVLPDDHQLKVLREEGPFTAAIRSTPLLAPWVAPGNSEPLSPVYAMAGLDNSSRMLGKQGAPAVAGFAALGDSVCTTNPAYGRGVSLALSQVFELADLLAEHPAVDERQAAEFAGRTERLVRPWLSESIANDKGRAALWDATVHGTEPPAPPRGQVFFGTAVAASAKDAVVWRRLARVMMMLDTPDTLYADDEIRERVGRALAGGPPPMPPGAGRQELLDAVSAANN
jgi:2-polyprenyl-6-methoxyphenol hydroxylase-like FAD-dependent oxidoreductase